MRNLIATIVVTGSFVGCEAFFPTTVADGGDAGGDAGVGDDGSSAGEAGDDASTGCQCGVPGGDGGCVPAPLATAQNVPRGIAVDSSYVYWTTNGSGLLLKMPLAGGTATTLANNILGAERVAVNGDSAFVAVSLAGNIVKVALDGSGSAILASGQGAPFDIALDATHVYWTNNGDGTVMRANLDGTARVALAQGRASPRFLAVDASRVYWSESVTDGGVRSVSVNGGGVADVASFINHPWGVALDPTTVYFDNDDGNIFAVGKPLGTPKIIDSSQDYPKAMLVDSQHIYWSNDFPGTGAVQRDSLAAPGHPVTIASNLNLPGNLAVDANCIYWVEEGSSPGTGRVWRADK